MGVAGTRQTVLAVVRGADPRRPRTPHLGHSDHHAGLQIFDNVCSGLLYLIACCAYRTGYVTNVQCNRGPRGSGSVTGNS